MNTPIDIIRTFEDLFTCKEYANISTKVKNISKSKQILQVYHSDGPKDYWINIEYNEKEL